jgi:hypothetical protein
MKLVSVKKSPLANKRYRATFEDSEGNQKHTDFGDPTMENYTIHKNALRKASYQARHRKDLETKDPTRAGYLSMFLLWGPSTSLEKNIELYKKRFNL